MFERYTERARRTLFLAREQALQSGNPAISPEHLLLSLVREGSGLTSEIFQRAHLSLDTICHEIGERAVGPTTDATTVEMPFSPETVRVLKSAAVQADRLRHLHIGTEHLLLGILAAPESVAAAALAARGITLESVRAKIVNLTDHFHPPE